MREKNVSFLHVDLNCTFFSVELLACLFLFEDPLIGDRKWCSRRLKEGIVLD